MGDQVELWELVDVAVQGLSKLGHPQKLANLARAKVVHPLEGKVFLLDLLHNVNRDLLELLKAQRYGHSLTIAFNSAFSDFLASIDQLKLHLTVRKRRGQGQ